MRSSKAKETSVAYVLAVVYVTLSMLPIFLSIHHRHNLILHKLPVEMNGGLMFSYPQICWIWTIPGIAVSMLCIAVMVLLSWALSKKIKDFSFKFWVCLSVFGWASFLAAFGYTHYENRQNHVFINDKEITISQKGQTNTFVVPGIEKIEIKERVVIFHLKDRRKYRLPKRTISLLIGNTILIEKLEALAQNLK
jgi:hypothetical protein